MSTSDKNDIVRSIAELLASQLSSVTERLNLIEGRLAEGIAQLKEDIRKEVIEEIRKEVRVDIGELQKENTELKRENRELRKDMEQTDNRMEELYQYSMKNDLIISGVPKINNENIDSTLNTLCSYMDVQIGPYDITAAHRLQRQKNGETSIIVRLISNRKKEEIVKAAKEKRPSAQLFGGKNDHFIYLNEHLTSRRSALFRKARELKLGNNFKYVWCRNGQILARRAENTPVHKIGNEEDIEKLRQNLN